MKKIIVLNIIILALISVGCNGQKDMSELADSIQGGEYYIPETEIIEKDEKTLILKGAMLNTYLEIPKYDEKSGLTVSVNNDGEGYSINYTSYSVLYGEVWDAHISANHINLESINKPDDILFVIKRYMYSLLTGPIEVENDRLHHFHKNWVAVEETKNVTINGYEFAIRKGYFEVRSLRNEEKVHRIYFYAYFSMFEGYPLLYMIADLDDDVVNSKTEVLDQMMTSFREFRDTDREN